MITALWFSLLCITFARAEEFRLFTDTQGREVEAKIIDSDPVKGRIQIERNDGKRSWVGPHIFSETDRNYIKEWIAADQVLSDENLVITLKKRKVRSFKKGMKDSEKSETNPRKGEEIRFEVNLKNRSKEPVEDLKIEYRYYILVAGAGDREDLERTVSGSNVVERIKESSSIMVETAGTVLEEKFKRIEVRDTTTRRLQGYEFQKLSEDQLLGLWLRIHGPTVDGIPAYRDVCYPEDLHKKVSWDKADDPYIEKMKQRGQTDDRMVFSSRIGTAVKDIKNAADESMLQQISIGIDFFYTEKMDPDGHYAFTVAASYYYRQRYDLSVLWARKAVRDRASGSSPHMLLAELYSSAPDPALNDGELAVKHALELEVKLHGNTAYSTDLLARAYARNGEFDLAVTTQEKAISLLGSHHKELHTPLFESRLERYRKKTPYSFSEEDPRGWFYDIKVNRIPLYPDVAKERSKYFVWGTMQLRTEIEGN